MKTTDMETQLLSTLTLLRTSEHSKDCIAVFHATQKEFTVMYDIMAVLDMLHSRKELATRDRIVDDLREFLNTQIKKYDNAFSD